MLARYLMPLILDALSDTPVVVLNGARQTGKSTLARQIAAQRSARYLTFDNAAALAAARSDPAGFLGGLNGGVVALDEVQRVPELFLALKAAVDLDPRPGRFLLTGSANILMLPKLADSLAGRMEILTLWPLSQGEMEGVRENFVDAVFSSRPLGFAGRVADRAGWIARIVEGGYPAILRRPSEGRRRAWYGSYITTILQRDVRDLANIDDLAALPRLLTLVASRAGSLLNFADLSRSLQMPQSTLVRYMVLLETTFLIAPLWSWSANLGKRMVKARKLYLNDTGLLAYLLGSNPEQLAADSMRLGPLLENFVVMELRKQAAWSRTQPQVFYFRLYAGQEVDVVLEDAAGNLVGIEVKASATVRADDFKGLKALAELTGRRFRRGVVVYLGSEVIPFGSRLEAVPLDALFTPGS